MGRRPKAVAQAAFRVGHRYKVKLSRPRSPDVDYTGVCVQEDGERVWLKADDCSAFRVSIERGIIGESQEVAK